MDTDPRTRIALLGDADRDVRLQAVMDLGEARHLDAAPALVARYAVEHDFFIREALTWASLRLADAAMPLVRLAIDSPRWPARLQAAHTLSKLGDPADGRRLLPLVDDPVGCVAARAWWAVAQCGDPALVPALVGQLGRGDSTMRNSLAVALTHLGAAAVPALVGALRHGHPAVVRESAADVLGQIGTPHAEPAADALLAALDDPDGGVGVAALNALGYLLAPAAWARIDALADRAPAPDGDGLPPDGHPRMPLLARRLRERRPSERAVRLAQVRGALDAPLADPVPSTPVHAPPATCPDPSLVTLAGGDWKAELAAPLALQVAVGRPQHLHRADVPAEEVEEVRHTALAAASADGHQPDLAARIAAGAVDQHLHRVVLLDQALVADPGKLVADLLRGKEVTITDFVRLPPVDDDRTLDVLTV